MAVANINEFISSFKTELSRPCNFEVEIIPPTKLAGVIGGGSIAKFRCEQAELPARAFVLIDQKTYGPIEHYPVQNTYNKSAMTFICGDDMKEKAFFDAWMEIISGKQHNGVKFDFEYKVNYCTDIKITQMSLDGKESYSVYLVDAFPAEVYSIPLSWAQVNDYNRLNVVIAYRYFKVYPAGMNSGELSQQQQQQNLVNALSKKAQDMAALKPPVLPSPTPKPNESTKPPTNDIGNQNINPPTTPPEISTPFPIGIGGTPEKPPIITVPAPDDRLVPVDKPPEISTPFPIGTGGIPEKPPIITVPAPDDRLVPVDKPPIITVPAPDDRFVNIDKPPIITVPAPDDRLVPVDKPPEISTPFPIGTGGIPEKPPIITVPAPDDRFVNVDKPPIINDGGMKPIENPPSKPPIIDDGGMKPVENPPSKPPEQPPAPQPPVSPVDPKPPEIKPPVTQILTTDVTFTYNGVSKSKTVQSEIKTPALTYEIMDALKNNTKVPDLPPAPSPAVIQKENLMEVKYSVSYTNQEGQTKTVEFSDWIKTPPEVIQAQKDLEAELKAQNPPPPPIVVNPSPKTGIGGIFGY